MSKPYTWEEVKSVLTNELLHSKQIMTFGTIGSLNVEHDIDLIVTKTPKSSIRSFFEELHSLFFYLDDYLMKKYGANAFCFSSSQEEIFINYLSKNSDKNLGFHIHIYLSLPVMERDWNWALSDNESLKDIILKGYNCLLGKPSDLFKKEFGRKSFYDPIYLHLYHYDKINSHYPDKLFIESMKHFLDFIYRKRLGLKTPLVKTRDQAIGAFYRLCDILEDLRKTKPSP